METGRPFPDLEAIFSPTEPPIDLAVMPEADATVSALIPIEGSELGATGEDGTVFHLAIPPDALLEATEISLTPLTRVEGLPTDGSVTYAAQLGADGLTLYRDAILTITPVVEMPVAEQIPFGYEADGEGMFLVAPVLEDDAMALRVAHFSGSGVTKGFLADLEPVRHRLGGSEEARLDSQIAEAIMKERQRPEEEREIDLDTLFSDAIAEYEAKVVAPRVAAAGQSCANGRLAVETVLRLEKQKAVLSLPDGGFPADLMQTMSHVCVQEEYELCRDEHLIHRILGVVWGLEVQRGVMGTPDAAEDAFGDEMARRCLTFELVLESEATLKKAPTRIDSVMGSAIKLEYEPESETISGSAKLENTDYEMLVPSPCEAANHPRSSTIEVMSLGWKDKASKADPVGAITDYTLTWEPAQTHESATIRCPGMRAVKAETGLWSMLFAILHQAEVQSASASLVTAFLQAAAPGGFQLPPLPPVERRGPFRTTGWKVEQHEHLATKSWTMHGANGVIAEEGSFDLYHKPS